jgi:hypothetical protein
MFEKTATKQIFVTTKTGVLYWADVNPSQILLRSCSEETNCFTVFTEFFQEVSENSMLKDTRQQAIAKTHANDLPTRFLV